VGGRYQLLGILGRGGMATVYDGWDVRLGRPVAVKVLHPGMNVDPANRARIEFEARSAAALNHPNIVVVHDGGDDSPHGGAPYLVMERMPGRSLLDAITAGPLTQDEVRRVLSDVLAGLSAAHAAGILHRDVKPANILFAAGGQAKIADFGVAKAGGNDLTLAGQVIGTMAYLSPERIAGRPATPLDDLYAVGAVGYQALTGRMPFPQAEPAALVRAISEHRLPPLSSVRPDVDPALASVVGRAMAPNPTHRFPDAEAMRAALAGVRPPTRVLDVPPAGTRLPPFGAGAPLPSPSRRRRILAGAAIAAAVVLALGLVVAEAVTSGPGTSGTPTSPTVTTSFVAPTTPTTLDATTSLETTAQPIPEHPGNGHGGGPKKPKHRKDE
jgi:serine/threonine-protein kinase